MILTTNLRDEYSLESILFICHEVQQKCTVHTNLNQSQIIVSPSKYSVFESILLCRFIAQTRSVSRCKSRLEELRKRDFLRQRLQKNKGGGKRMKKRKRIKRNDPKELRVAKPNFQRDLAQRLAKEALEMFGDACTGGWSHLLDDLLRVLVEELIHRLADHVVAV